MIKEKTDMVVVGFRLDKNLAKEIDKRVEERGMTKKAWITQAILLKMSQEDKYK